ncbi:hypothetical protein C1H46_039412 [Malus baccata]|uniref:Uncharacterized protein n=1 Tax=Malus baccata TaxID=106549 RepID=A0A540KLF1_MALBA|nr:hypothetical protein C1H46_039412 [Malus baccata]
MLRCSWRWFSGIRVGQFSHQSNKGKEYSQCTKFAGTKTQPEKLITNFSPTTCTSYKQFVMRIQQAHRSQTGTTRRGYSSPANSLYNSRGCCASKACESLQNHAESLPNISSIASCSLRFLTSRTPQLLDFLSAQTGTHNHQLAVALGPPTTVLVQFASRNHLDHGTAELGREQMPVKACWIITDQDVVLAAHTFKLAEKTIHIDQGSLNYDLRAKTKFQNLVMSLLPFKNQWHKAERLDSKRKGITVNLQTLASDMGTNQKGFSWLVSRAK